MEPQEPRRVFVPEDKRPRCGWALSDAAMCRYHDQRWGRPVHDGQALFAMLCLEGQQAGLSWRTVLQKEAHYREVFHDFDPVFCASLQDNQLALMVQDAQLIRHLGKLKAIRQNAQAYLSFLDDVDFSRWVWSFVGGTPMSIWRRSLSEIPAKTARSCALAKALKDKGFVFVGPTIVYAWMQACGLVNDHLAHCFVRKEQP